jgi:tRNA dimethylallyltransferase
MNAESRQPIVVVAGPTGSGKSALALALAERFRGSIVNADSQQVYRELRVLTQRPSAADEARVPHYLYGILPASERCSAGRWLGLALAAITAIRVAGRLPIVAGGTGLYLKTLIEGIAEIPPLPPEIVAETRDLRERIGNAAFRAELAQLDADGAARIAVSDSQRLVRAYAVVRATGLPLAEWHRRAKRHDHVPPGRFLMLALDPPRAALDGRLDARFDAMMAEGALAEARVLAALGLDPTLPAVKAVGVRELLVHLDGRATMAEAVASAKRTTRQFAKRQRTWLRNQIEVSSAFSAFGEEAMAEAAGAVTKFLAERD